MNILVVQSGQHRYDCVGANGHPFLQTPRLDGLAAEGMRFTDSYCPNQFGLFSQRTVRDREWKYVWNATAEDELYHMVDDPAELTNRALDPACADVLARLRVWLVEWMEETGDRLLNTWTRPQILEGRTR